MNPGSNVKMRMNRPNAMVCAVLLSLAVSSASVAAVVTGTPTKPPATPPAYVPVGAPAPVPARAPVGAPLAPPAAVPATVPVETNPCAPLTKLGGVSYLYSKSSVPLTVKFTTNFELFSLFTPVHAGAVKYFANGTWIDSGTGDDRYSRTYLIPVDANQTVQIAYCANEVKTLDAKSLTWSSHTFFAGAVELFLRDAKKSYNHATIYGFDSVPGFRSLGSEFVWYGHDAKNASQPGSITMLTPTPKK